MRTCVSVKISNSLECNQAYMNMIKVKKMWKGFKNNSKYSKCTNEPCLVWTWLCPLPLPLSLLGLIYFARGPSPIRDFCNFFYCGQVSQIRSTSLSAMSSFHNLEKGFLQCDLLFFLSLNAKWMSIVKWMNIKRIRWPCPKLFVWHCMDDIIIGDFILFNTITFVIIWFGIFSSWLML